MAARSRSGLRLDSRSRRRTCRSWHALRRSRSRRNASGEPMRSNLSESFLSLPDDAARNALRQVWNEDGKLVPESRYKANRSPEFIEAEIERLKAELDLKRGPDPLLSAPTAADDSKPERKTARERRIERLERASE